MKNKTIKRLLSFAGLLAIMFFISSFALAAAPEIGLDYAAGTGLSADQDIRVTIAKIIRVIIGFLGIIAVGLIMYAGWLWMTSEGNEEKIEQAKKVLTNAVIGLVIILSSFGITTFILNQLTGAGSNQAALTTGGGAGTGGGAAALGSGIINSHHPERNQQAVPRNTKIIITFKEPMEAASLMSGGLVNGQNVKIYKTKDGVSGAVTFDVKASKTEDNKTFVFSPAQYLGSPAEKIWYSVALSKNLKKASGDGAFAGAVGEIAYDWMFEVGTYLDNTPPKILSIIPTPAATEARNVAVAITFSEALDPTSASGGTKNGFSNIKVLDSAASGLIAGNFYISNQYRTVEFLTDSECGLNSCGNTVYCLPADKKIKVFAAAASLETPGSPAAIFPPSGVVDMAGNSLDGNSNGTAEGPSAKPFNADNSTHEGEGDDYVWTFNTSAEINVTPPLAEALEPPVNGTGVDISAAVKAIFNKPLLSSTLNNSSVSLKSGAAAYNYWVTGGGSGGKGLVNVSHDQFNENVDYSVRLNSGIKDIYQNCYTPCSGLGITGNPSCCNGVASSGNSCP